MTVGLNHSHRQALQRLILVLCLFRVCGAQTYSAAAQELSYFPAPPDNPLKGLVPYAGEKRDRFPHSLEFGYLPLSDLMQGPDEFDWAPLERLLNDVASRGHQTVFRVWMVYPGHEEGIPRYLVEDGLKVTTWLNTNTEPFPPSNVRTPDYDDPRMRVALRRFIRALGEKYDGDARVGFITAGLLGTWGEWHEYPRSDLFASRKTQAEVMDAYEASFQKTPVLLRYPAGEGHGHYASNADRRFGYHDDSFAWATLDTGREQDAWFFVPALKSAGRAAVEKWKSSPIGGEIRPELWGGIFDESVTVQGAQDFARCVKETHATWLMDTGMFEAQGADARVANAIGAVQRMGYEFHVAECGVSRRGERVHISAKVRNTGVAPMYHGWSLELGFSDGSGRISRGPGLPWTLTGLLPGTEDRSWSHTIGLDDVPEAAETVFFRVRNPLDSGLPLRFANDAEHQRADGWFLLGRVRSVGPTDSRGTP